MTSSCCASLLHKVLSLASLAVLLTLFYDLVSQGIGMAWVPPCLLGFINVSSRGELFTMTTNVKCYDKKTMFYHFVQHAIV